MRARWSLNARAAALGLVVTALVVGPAAAVSATPPVTLGTGYVLDDVGILTTDEISAAEANLTEFRDESGLDLWVVFVDEFTDPSSSADWANQTALDNGLGPTQYLLAVATESRQLYLSGDSAGPVTDDQLAAIEQNDTQPALRDNDWLGAIDATAAGLGDAVGITTGSGTDGGSTDGGGPATSGGSGGSSGVLPLLAVGAVVVAGFVLVGWVLLRKRKRPTGAGVEAPVVSTEELEQQASAALVATDDAITTSTQELGFARAQFGDEATAEFEDALARARATMTEAFALQQSLDDEKPDTDASARAAYSASSNSARRRTPTSMPRPRPSTNCASSSRTLPRRWSASRTRGHRPRLRSKQPMPLWSPSGLDSRRRPSPRSRTTPIRPALAWSSPPSNSPKPSATSARAGAARLLSAFVPPKTRSIRRGSSRKRSTTSRRTSPRVRARRPHSPANSRRTLRRPRHSPTRMAASLRQRSRPGAVSTKHGSCSSRRAGPSPRWRHCALRMTRSMP